jgi:hypothetical protein
LFPIVERWLDLTEQANKLWLDFLEQLPGLRGCRYFDRHLKQVCQDAIMPGTSPVLSLLYEATQE